MSNFVLEAGDAIVIEAMGGAGFGDPLGRDQESVLEDVALEYISIDHARAAYGVVIEARDVETLAFRVDEEATDALRQRLARQKEEEMPSA